MATLPSFCGRTDPAFRPARIYHILASQDGLYFIRTKSLLAASDAGQGPSYQSRTSRAIAGFIAEVAAEGTAKSEAQIAREGPDALVQGSRHNFFAPTADVMTSSLVPGKLLSPSVARWKVEFRSRKPMTFEIESDDDLTVARAEFPGLLGDRLEIRLKSGCQTPSTRRVHRWAG